MIGFGLAAAGAAGVVAALCCCLCATPPLVVVSVPEPTEATDASTEASDWTRSPVVVPSLEDAGMCEPVDAATKPHADTCFPAKQVEELCTTARAFCGTSCPSPSPRPCGGACASKQVCIDNVCKYVCKTSLDCERIDARIGLCSPDHLCDEPLAD